jgi:NADH dehydrogenase
LTFVIVGAGPTGVEIAGMIAELAKYRLPEEFRRIDSRRARVLLVEGGERVLPAFSSKLSEYARSALTGLGVDVRLGSPVSGIGKGGVTIDGEVIRSETIIWAAGVQASPAAHWLSVPSDRAGRVKVGRDLTIAGDRDVFVVGDTALVAQDDGTSVPGVAPAAKQQGHFVARLIAARLAGKPEPGPFRYKHQGNLATIGRSAAVVDLGWLQLKGWAAWWIWGIAHIYFLVGTRSRLAVVSSWLWIHFTGQHSARLITQKETIRSPPPDNLS